jgi:hypothetical protein
MALPSKYPYLSDLLLKMEKTASAPIQGPSLLTHDPGSQHDRQPDLPTAEVSPIDTLGPDDGPQGGIVYLTGFRFWGVTAAYVRRPLMILHIEQALGLRPSYSWSTSNLRLSQHAL